MESKLQIYAQHNAPIDEVTYVIWQTGKSECMIVDPCDYRRILYFLNKNEIRCTCILLTHEHYDHICGVNDLKKCTQAEIIASETCAAGAQNAKANLSVYYDALMELHGIENWERINECYAMVTADIVFSGDYFFRFYDFSVHMTETPGHSPGSTCIEIGNCVFTGDSLLKDTPVFTRGPRGSRRDYQLKTMPYLANIDKDMMIYPGHGEMFRMRDCKFLKD